jgi:hypothetical protein
LSHPERQEQIIDRRERSEPLAQMFPHTAFASSPDRNFFVKACISSLVFAGQDSLFLSFSL